MKLNDTHFFDYLSIRNDKLSLEREKKLVYLFIINTHKSIK